MSGDVGCCVVNKKLGKLFAIASAASTKRQQTPRCSRPSAFKLLFLFHFSEAFRVLKRKLKKSFLLFLFPQMYLCVKVDRLHSVLGLCFTDFTAALSACFTRTSPQFSLSFSYQTITVHSSAI